MPHAIIKVSNTQRMVPARIWKDPLDFNRLESADFFSTTPGKEVL